MLRYLLDPANAITASGMILSGVALSLVTDGRIELAVAVALWAMLADHLDGIVARRIRNRSEAAATMGKSLDGFSDLIYGAVFPSIALLQLHGVTLLSAAVGTTLLVAGALRLSYFGITGLSTDRCFTGLPLSYDVPILALLVLAEPFVQQPLFSWLLPGTFATLAALHVSSIRVPAPTRSMYIAIVLFSVAASAALSIRALFFA
ncbi:MULTISPECIES: CDP-alcohol phosphatidyltransferase family protein [Bradyrhizobium]|jgi:CDP-diacylglycerol--serine O-phosphatidyltransferase|uniref:CDP-alcohol phosphatidyltransferase family protein n=1 Tax=Bradyrhizobium TaxID=374 RepID=UPI000360105C|nr:MULTISPECIES: CDP-alcohol phosphatidyltransferase family protein [Bradyrhizobium]MCP1728937.1 CDP-diacylglycerol--serine O-phosphatidyltransferase [Bradyrhizobium elkanii]MCS3573062.1 CDP-diacylglycerol--serine O-phosphatidyltransferase [Bradyrhizobium elkanii]MCS3594245.1 CDP-diacylglycerol--serine O-phosphatidyltransferase [Bradyrhizobium elkanii]MCS3623688.1 CDP-diacylglycerol--serine O-phosphatidyltransferase [Bradyrhizobium elkanii]MCW2117184.1 CDP-diacylglycerol--serine O-phosphatidyl